MSFFALCTLFLLTACGEYVLVSKDRSEQLMEGQRLRYYAQDTQAETLLKQAYASSNRVVRSEAAFQLAELAHKKQQPDQALHYLKEAFKEGYTGSEVKLAKAYLNASPGVRNYDFAERILQQHKHESIDAAMSLAKLYVVKQQYSKALPPAQLAEKMYHFSDNPTGDALQLARIYRDIYFSGIYPSQTLPKAKQWYQTAQARGERQESPVELAKLLLFNTKPGSQPYNEAVTILQASAAQNNPDAMAKLGDTYYDAQDNEQALYWFTRREQMGDTDGTNAYNIGKVYKRTREQEGHPEQMQSWYEKAIARGSQEAKETWAAYQAHEREKEIVRQEKLKEQQLREARRAELRQMAVISPQTGKAFDTLSKSENEAYQEFKKLADSGESLHAMLMVDSWQEKKGRAAYHSTYQNLSGKILFQGIAQNESQLGDARKDQIARQWTLATQYGSLDAAYQLAEHYKNTKPDLADKWMTQAASMGSGKAMLHKAREIAVNGKGEQTDQQVFKWYEKAAQAGEPEGQYQAGQMYSQGKGVTKNLQKAKYWLSEAKKNGYHLASDAMSMAE